MPEPIAPAPTIRHELLTKLDPSVVHDLLVVGGGATGLGLALDAASRGYRVVLLEAADFAKGTSSRSTKLIHGGVRYLAQGNVSLVREALVERSTLLRNAPHIAQPLAFVMPSYHCLKMGWYGVGLTVYDALAGRYGLGKTAMLTKQQTMGHLPTVQTQRLCGGVKYWDGQFNDARLAVALARSAAACGAVLLNYMKVSGLHYSAEKISGVTCTDSFSGQTHQIQARCVVNATGVWVDALRHLDGATEPIVAPSQGVHLVVDKKFLPGNTALIIPKTDDGRVLFAVPWLGKLILGTTDTPCQNLSQEPQAQAAEIDFILREAGRYLNPAPSRSDVRSIWVGLRPLVKPASSAGEHTKAISREHTIQVSRSGLVTVTGGKWTTYRAMAEDVLDQCVAASLLPAKGVAMTDHFKLMGAPAAAEQMVALSEPEGLHSYGTEQAWVNALDGHEEWLAPGLSAAMVRFAAKYEYAIQVEDVLARRSRLLFLDAKLASQLANRVGQILRSETGMDPHVEEFITLAEQYLLPA